MRYLEAKNQQKPGDAPENKMQPGSRVDQRPPGRIQVIVPPDSGHDFFLSPEEQLAKTLGVDYATITGTGANGKITAKDVRNAAKALKKASSTLQVDDGAIGGR